MTKNFETGITFDLYADPDYRYQVEVSDDHLAVRYIEPAKVLDVGITFGSLDEMEATAKLMLEAVAAGRKMKVV